MTAILTIEEQREGLLQEAKKKKWTAQRLYASTVRFKKWRSNYSSSRTRTLVKVIPYVGTKTVLFHFESKGLTVRATHQIFIAFHEIEVLDTPKAGYIEIEFRNEKYWMEKPDMYKTPIRVRCSCSDFFFSFGLWNFQEGALFGGRPRPYRRKTKTFPPRNPKHIPGVCKHLFNALLWLQTNNYTSQKRKLK
jgi:hypothetical protein